MFQPNHNFYMKFHQTKNITITTLVSGTSAKCERFNNKNCVQIILHTDFANMHVST